MEYTDFVVILIQDMILWKPLKEVLK
jgi:hypothetical protein